jgi:hypothetical protein
MAKTIEPISSWQNGEEKQATVFTLISSYDNLATGASFDYQLSEIVLITVFPNVLYPSLNTLITGTLAISGQDYLDWDAATDANEWIYNWTATQLKIIIIGEYVPPAPPEPTPDPIPTAPIITEPTS